MLLSRFLIIIVCIVVWHEILEIQIGHWNIWYFGVWPVIPEPSVPHSALLVASSPAIPLRLHSHGVSLLPSAGRGPEPARQPPPSWSWRCGWTASSGSCAASPSPPAARTWSTPWRTPPDAPDASHSSNDGATTSGCWRRRSTRSRWAGRRVTMSGRVTVGSVVTATGTYSHR